jgi:hypothetical protein
MCKGAIVKEPMALARALLIAALEILSVSLEKEVTNRKVSSTSRNRRRLGFVGT